MNYNSYTKSITKLAPDAPIEMLQAKCSDLVCTTAFFPYMIDEEFCVGFAEVPSLSGGEQEVGYYFDKGYLTVPRRMYRTEGLFGPKVGQELAQSMAEGGQAICVPYITNVHIGKTSEQCAENLTLHHYCSGETPLGVGKGKTGGGVCGKKLKSTLGYVTEQWDWGEVYTTDPNDPFKIKDDKKRALVHHYLMGRFDLEEGVRLISLLMPDNNIVRVSYTGNEHEKVHEMLTDPKHDDRVYGITNLTFLDGPDIFIGDCDFGL